MRRLFAALVFVALACPLTLLAIGSDQAVGIVIVVGAFTVGATLLIGLPLALWSIRKGWLRLWQATLAGAAVGVLCAAPLFNHGPAEHALQYFLRFGALGATHGVAFWLLAFFRNQALTKHEVAQSKGAGAESAA
jgi:hypothetical protein